MNCTMYVPFPHLTVHMEPALAHRFTLGTVGHRACTPSGTNEAPASGHRRLRLNHRVTQLVDEGSAENVSEHEETAKGIMAFTSRVSGTYMRG